MFETITHITNWWTTIVVIGLYGGVLLFLPLNLQARNKNPSYVYLAFVTLSSIEHYGLKLSQHLIHAITGITPGTGIWTGITLLDWIGPIGGVITVSLITIGITLIVHGWQQIYKRHYQHVRGSSHIVKTGLYRYIRHPQYLGLILLSTGIAASWLTLFTILGPLVILILFVRLAKQEEGELIATYNEEYIQYRQDTNFILPWIW